MTMRFWLTFIIAAPVTFLLLKMLFG